MTNKKGIVVERSNDWAIILMPTGEYKKINTHKYLEVGDLYTEGIGGPFKYIAVAIIMLAFIMGGIDYYSVQAYASLTSNLELGVNRWGRVVSVQAKDSEAQRILNAVKVKNDKLEVAVAKISQQSMEEKQNSTDSIRKSLNVVAKDKKNQNLEKIMLKKMNTGLEKASPKKQKESTDNQTSNNEIKTEDQNDSLANNKQVFKFNESETEQNTSQQKDKKIKLHEKKLKPDN